MSRRAELLETSRILDTAALDPYEFLRDAYLQRRRNLVFDGNPPPDQDNDLDIKVKPKPGASGLSTFPQSADAPQVPYSVFGSGTELTPAQLEAREREAERSRAKEPRVESAPAASQPRVTRIWLPSSR